MYVPGRKGLTRVPNEMASRFFDAQEQVLEFRRRCRHLLEDPRNDELQFLIAAEIELAIVKTKVSLTGVLLEAAEAGPVLERLRHNAPKGGAARRKKVAPTHKAIQKRFRELRKSIPKKTVRYLRIAGEYEMSDRHVARIVEGID